MEDLFFPVERETGCCFHSLGAVAPLPLPSLLSSGTELELVSSEPQKRSTVLQRLACVEDGRDRFAMLIVSLTDATTSALHWSETLQWIYHSLNDGHRLPLHSFTTLLPPGGRRPYCTYGLKWKTLFFCSFFPFA